MKLISQKKENVIKFLKIFLLILMVSRIVIAFAFELRGGQYSSTDISDMDYKVSPYADHKTEIQNAANPAATSWEDIVDNDTPDWHEVTSGSYEVYITDYEDEYGDLGWTYNDPAYGTTDSSIIWINDYYLDEVYYTDSDHFQWLLAHEMGHVQGLDHEQSFGPTVLMYRYDSSYLSNGIYTPQYDDEAGIRDLYE